MVLAFGVTSKEFTPCLGVLHEIWGMGCMVDPWGFMMDLNIGGDFLLTC